MKPTIQVEGKTTIQVDKETAKALRKLQNYPEEPYDLIVKRLIEKYRRQPC